MSDILATLERSSFVEFVNLFKPEEGRMGVTVTFVAILELVREGLIDIVQTEAYAPLHVRGAQGARGLRLAVDNDSIVDDAVPDADVEGAANESADEPVIDESDRTSQSNRMESSMSDAYFKNVVEAALLAAARPVSIAELQQIFDEQSRPSAEGNARGSRAARRRLRRPRRRHQGNRHRLPFPGAHRVRARSVAPVARPPAQVLARVARDARAHRLSPAHHARRNRKRARRGREPRNRQDAHGAQLGARRRPSRRARAARVVRHHGRVPRLLLAQVHRRPAAARRAQVAHRSQPAAAAAGECRR